MVWCAQHFGASGFLKCWCAQHFGGSRGQKCWRAHDFCACTCSQGLSSGAPNLIRPACRVAISESGHNPPTPSSRAPNFRRPARHAAISGSGHKSHIIRRPTLAEHRILAVPHVMLRFPGPDIIRRPPLPPNSSRPERHATISGSGNNRRPSLPEH